MIPFEWLEPASMNEAVDLLDAGDEATRPVSGGTALMLMMKAGVFAPSRLVSLHRIERHYAEMALTDRNLEVGALATLASLERSAEVAAAFPVIAATMARLSNPRVRNVACVGGALAHGDPHMDLPPIMAALDASVTTMGPATSRTLRVDELYAGYYETALARNELICSVTVPRRFNRRAAYLKMTARTADDWPALGVAVAFTRHGETLADVRVVVSAATPMVMRLRTRRRFSKEPRPTMRPCARPERPRPAKHR